MKQDVLPVILGTEGGAYALAHAFYHDYGIIPLVLDESFPPLFSHTFSAFACEVKNLRKSDIFYRTLEDIAGKAKGKSLILIPASADYLSLTREREQALSKMFLMPHLPTPSADTLPENPVSLALLYRTGEGQCRTVFSRVLAKAPSGSVTALLAEPIPEEIDERIKEEAKALSRGIYLFYLDKEGGLCREASVLPALIAFCAAKDASIPEWMIAETVLCIPLPKTQAELSGVFTLFPYGKTKRFLSRAQRRALRFRQKCALYTFKEEGARRDIARVFRALFREHVKEK